MDNKLKYLYGERKRILTIKIIVVLFWFIFPGSFYVHSDLHFEVWKSPDLYSVNPVLIKFKFVLLGKEHLTLGIEEAVPGNYQTIIGHDMIVELPTLETTTTTIFCDSGTQLHPFRGAINILKLPFSFSRFAVFLEYAELLFSIIQERDHTTWQS